MTDQAIAAFDIEGAAKRVKAQIHAAWAALIPDEKLEEMARAELKTFLEVEFPKLCNEEFSKVVRVEIQKHLQSLAWQRQWQPDATGGAPGAAPAIQEWLDKNQSNLVKLVLTELFNSTLFRLVEQARTTRY